MPISNRLQFLISVFIRAIAYIRIYHLRHNTRSADAIENNYTLTNQISKNHRSISNHSDNEKNEKYVFIQCENPKILPTQNNKTILENNSDIDYNIINSDNTSIDNTSASSTLKMVNYKKQPHDYIYLYQRYLTRSSILTSMEITFGYGHNRQCCFPNTIGEFKRKCKKKRILGEGSYGMVTKILTKCCNSGYALKTVTIRRLSCYLNLGYYNTEMYFVKYFQLNPLPYIIKFYQVYYYNGKVYIVSELLKNNTLEKINFLGNKYDEKKLDKYIKGIFIGIASLHKNKIVHGDIKKDNIGIDANDNIKIFDFGLSNKFDSGYCRMATKGGASAYKPPEYLFSNKNVSYQTDWWAFGVLIYMLVENRHPFDSRGRGLIEMFQSLKKNIEQRNFNKFINKKVSRKLKNLIKKLLEPDITKRLGVGENAIENILKHPYFKSKNFEELTKQ